MNKENFLKWFRNQLLPKLEEPSIIIMDNATYHSSLIEKLPNSNWKKAELQNWLQERKVQFPSDALKTHLMDIAKRLVPTYYLMNHLLINPF